MKGKWEKWLWAAAPAALSAAAGVLAVRAATGYMVRMAMDRNTPDYRWSRLSRVSGTAENAALMAVAAAFGERLEASGSQCVETRSHDGLRLVGHWRPCEEPKRILIAMHGWRSCWGRDFAMTAEFFRENGCSVLYPEQRGQGKSGGDYIGFGMLERHDCLCWIRWVTQRYPELPVYLVGISMGATTVLMTGGMDLPEQVRGIIADCGFTSPQAIWRHVAEKNLHLRYGWYAQAARDLCKRKIRMTPEDYSTLDALAECEVPVLLIHGTDDTFVPISMTYENYKACAAPKRLLVVPGAGHGLSCWVDKKRYEQAILDFWQDFDPKTFD